MANKRKLSDADKVAIRREVRNGTATRALAERYNCSVPTILNALKEGGRKVQATGKWAKVDKEARKERIKELLAEGLEQKEIAKKLAISEGLVSLILKGER